MDPRVQDGELDYEPEGDLGWFDACRLNARGAPPAVRRNARYRIRVVYKARDHALDRWVAVKVLAPRLRANTDFIERFLREAQSAGRLSHPNVVPIHGIGDEEGQRFYAMEFVRGAFLPLYSSEAFSLLSTPKVFGRRGCRWCRT